MKLSKEEFLEVLMEAAHHTSKINGQKCVEIHDALLDNALEIDGYERVQWTRFDWDNPKTFPPDDKIVLAYGLPDPLKNRSCAVYFFAWADSAGMFLGQESAAPEVHFWHPLPPPPVETEESK